MKQFINGYGIASVAIIRRRQKTNNYTDTSNMPLEDVNEVPTRITED
jgi:hypothetical protein